MATGTGRRRPIPLINIEAEPAPAGMLFDYWSGDTTTMVNVDAPVTTLRMPAATVTITAVFKSASTVGDGIPDSWRSTHFGGDGSTATALSAADADPDHDGKSNLEEFMAGTDPNDPNSFFELSFAELEGEDLAVEFTTSPLNHYLLQSSSTLAAGSWSTESFEIIGDGSPVQLMFEMGTDPRKFFRIKSTVDAEEPLKA